MRISSKNLGMSILGLLAAGALPACGSDDGGSGGPAFLSKATPGATDANCPGGGTKLDFGADNNGNGELDGDEIKTSQLVCNEGPTTLTTVTPTGASMKCPNGGTTIKSGADTNRNGVLDDSEVTKTDEICGGGTSTELIKTTALAEGDVNCPFGGSRVERGLDNGANGAVAGDGVLQDGEVQTTSLACITNSFGSSFAAPPGAVGTGAILTAGGAGSTTTGGLGGSFQFGHFGDSTGGHVKIFKTGTVDANFTPPVEVPVFGATKLDVVANRTIASYGSSAGAADGEYYTLNGGGLFFRQNAGNPQVTVTGVHVAPGVTLTFAVATNFTLTDDLHNEGTITSAVTSGNRAGLGMTVGKFLGTATSSIALAGAAVAGGAGGNGGSLQVTANRIVNLGTVDTSGANGDAGGAFNGGSGGTIVFNAAAAPASGPAVQAGNVKTSGGAGKAAGGSAGSYLLLSLTRGVWFKGDLNANGGSGVSSSGTGGFIQMDAQFGEARIAGSLTAKGGDVDEAACAGACPGGLGGFMFAVARGGDLRFSGSAILSGGKGKGAPGGNCQQALFATTNTSDPVTAAARPAGSVRASGTFDLRGGSGASGGNGGFLQIFSQPGPLPNGQEIELRGIANVDMSGGNGVTGGGNGGGIFARAGFGSNGSGMVIHPALVSRGGNTATSGAGGSGGSFNIGAADPTTPGVPQKARALLLVGGIDVSGGNGISGGGPAGGGFLASTERIDVFAPIVALGGNATGASSGGGVAQPLDIRTGGAFTSTAAIAPKGGNASGATSTGGGCQGLRVIAGSIKTTAALSCSGGNGNGAAGGAGGTVEVNASQSASVTAGVSAPGGTGTPNGTAGTVTIDGNAQP